MNIHYSGARRGRTRLSAIVPMLMILVLYPLSGLGSASIDDAKITDQVDSEFHFDPAVPFHTIDVSTDDGIVTLTGRVSNLLASQRATRIAETVRGVRSVINRIEVEPLVERPARWLQDAVKNALLYDSATDAYEIEVAANDTGLVTLSGTVDSGAERELAETVASGVSGITAVSNNIIVKPKLSRMDGEIQKDIVKRLHWDRLVDDGLIDVKVKDSKVSLSGVVGSAAEKRRAFSNAWVAGVKAVDNSALKVEKWARDQALRKTKYQSRSDLEIIDAVSDALIYDPRVNALNIKVRVNDGRVTLRGVVDNIQAMIAAQRDAENTVGVLQVNSLIKVRPVTDLKREDIADNVRQALLRNPFTESYSIDVRVNNQVVHLQGMVDSYFEKAEAENEAFLAQGVAEVRNKLKVRQPRTLNYDPYVYSWSIYSYPWYETVTLLPYTNDWDITTRIKDELFWSPFVDSEDIEVSTEAGIATLSGDVDSWTEYRAARENAFEGGAIGVINKLEVEENS